MKTIKDAVELFKKWPDGAVYLVAGISCDRIEIIYIGSVKADIALPESWKYLCNQYEFEATAKRMGYINGYRYGVEYPTNGKRPDLPGDVLCNTTYMDGDSLNYNDHTVKDWDWPVLRSFHIIDPRYAPIEEISEIKPDEAGVSENFYVIDEDSPVVKLDIKAEEGLYSMKQEKESNWFERGESPPTGTYCQVKQKNEFVNCYIVGPDDCGATVYRSDGFYGAKMDQSLFRPIRTRREKVIEAAELVIRKTSSAVDNVLLDALYNAGMLVLPQNSGDTDSLNSKE